MIIIHKLFYYIDQVHLRILMFHLHQTNHSIFFNSPLNIIYNYPSTIIPTLINYLVDIFFTINQNVSLALIIYVNPSILNNSTNLL